MPRGRLNGARGAALLVAAAYCLGRAIAYLPIGGRVDKLPRGLELISTTIPIEAWGALWLAAACVCAVAAFRKQDAVGWGAITGIMTAWGVAYAYGWLESIVNGQESREWLNATTYLGPALIIALLSIWHSRGGSRAG